MSGSDDIQLNEAALHKFYSTYFQYYNLLDVNSKKKFISRCLIFISDKFITGAEGFVPDNRVRALVAASAVQLTLGLETWELNYFDTIILHPEEFNSAVKGLKYKGETNLAGYIKLSWKNFLKGYVNYTDNLNLGLHEFSHAMHLNAFKGGDQDYFLEHFFPRWISTAKESYNELRKGKDSIFRKYGGANLNEFLSVCIEHYFESPEEFLAEKPTLYYCTALLLNQEYYNGKVSIDVRENIFVKLNRLQNFENALDLKSRWKSSALIVILPLIIFLSIITILSSGFLSMPSLTLVLLFFALLIYMDVKTIHVHTGEKFFTVSKGAIFFKRKKTVSMAQLVSIRIHREEKKADYELIYFRTENQAFYRERVYDNDLPEQNLLNEWIAKGIAVFNR